MSKFSEMIKETYRKYKYEGKVNSLEEFAKMLGVSKSTIVCYMSERHKPNDRFKFTLAKIIGVDYKELFDTEPHDENSPELYYKLKDLCIKNGLKERELCELIGKYESYLSCLKHNKTSLEPEVADKICEIFGVTRSWLYDEDDYSYVIDKFHKLSKANKNYVADIIISLSN